MVFNLLLGDTNDLFVYSNRDEIQKLSEGVYGLSNRLLDTPWPKVKKRKETAGSGSRKKGNELEESLCPACGPPDSAGQ